MEIFIYKDQIGINGKCWICNEILDKCKGHEYQKVEIKEFEKDYQIKIERVN